MTIRREDNSSVGSGTDGGNSDIGDLADFSAEEEESQLEQLPSCRIPGCQCEGRIEYMQWDSDDMTDSEDSAEGTWEDYEEGSDDLEIKSAEGAPVVPQTESQTKIRNMTIRREDNSSVGSGTDGGNSDIGDLADFSAEEEESQLEQLPGCRIPGCQCEGRIEYMEWDSDDMTDSEDSEWEDPAEREKRLWVEEYNYDLIEGMTLMTYTPPTRKNRRRRYEDKVTCTPEVQKANCGTNERETGVAADDGCR